MLFVSGMTSGVIFEVCAIYHKSPVEHSVRESAEGRFMARATVVLDKEAMLCLNPSWKTPYNRGQLLLEEKIEKKPIQLEKKIEKKAGGFKSEK